MNCIAIETTGRHLGLTILSFDPNKKTIQWKKSYFKAQPAKQSDLLLPQLTRLMKKCQLRKKDIDLIAADVGPGSFTGVRVGVATARALGQLLSKPCVGVSSLEAIAYQAGMKLGRPGRLIVCRPALTKELYFAVYDWPSKKVIVPPTWEKTSEFLKHILRYRQKKNTYMAGDQADTIRSEMKKIKNIKWAGTQLSAHPESIARQAVTNYENEKRKKFFHYQYLKPLYLQPSWAERKHEAR